MSEEENNTKEMTIVTWILIGLIVLAGLMFGGMILGLLFIFYMIR